jgi:Zn-dependent metalloprotease
VHNTPQCLPTHLPLYVNTGHWAGAGYDPANKRFLFETPYLALDIVAHELAHCVTRELFSTAIGCGGECGALFESFGDIFGEAVERSETGQNDWVLSNQTLPFTGLARMMKTPLQASPAQPDTYKGQKWAPTSPVLETNDWGGTHGNSSVQSKWFRGCPERGE